MQASCGTDFFSGHGALSLVEKIRSMYRNQTRGPSLLLPLPPPLLNHDVLLHAHCSATKPPSLSAQRVPSRWADDGFKAARRDLREQKRKGDRAGVALISRGIESVGGGKGAPPPPTAHTNNEHRRLFRPPMFVLSWSDGVPIGRRVDNFSQSRKRPVGTTERSASFRNTTGPESQMYTSSAGK